MNFIPGSVANSSILQQGDRPFTQEDLELQWLSMCNRMPTELSGIAARMKNMTPVITEGTQVEVTVDNALIKHDIDQISKTILKTLQVYLQNSQITLTILVNEKPADVKILTRREQFELMRKKNPAVELLRQAFDLELA